MTHLLSLDYLPSLSSLQLQSIEPMIVKGLRSGEREAHEREIGI